MLVVIIIAASVARVGVCDGPAPGWAKSEGGCANWSVIEHAFPWNWGVPDQCVGVCQPQLLDQEQR